MGFGSLFASKNNSGSPSTHNSPGETPLFSRASSISSSRAARTRTQIDELEVVFKKFDANGDGKISSTELGAIMENLGQPSNEEELQKMVLEADKDGDGFIDLNEFIELNTKGIDTLELMESLKDAFSVFDIDENGLISAEELHEVLRSLGEECSVAECRKMISGVDVDGDGMISFDEFKVMMDRGSRYDAMDRSLTVQNE